MTKEELAEVLTGALTNSGLSIDEQIKAIGMARNQITQPYREQNTENWRENRKPLVKAGKPTKEER